MRMMQLKKRTIAFGLVCIVVLSAFLYFVAIPRVSVSGTGTVTAYPDEADLFLSVRTQNQTAADTAATNGRIMTSVYNSLSTVGVNKSEVKTISYSLSPTYDSENNTKLVGFVAVNSIEIVVTGIENLPNVGKIIDAAVSAGANQVDGISFTFTDSNSNTLQAEAYEKAVHDANSQASAIVSGLGGVIIGVAFVSTNYGYAILSPQPIAYGGSMENKPSTPINSGSQQITATVNITYLYL